MLNYKAYRYEDYLTSSGSEEYGYNTQVNIRLQEYNVIKETLHGFWIELYPNKNKFVRLDTRKKFACISKPDAWYSFVARKQHQIRILKAKLQDAEIALDLSKQYIYNNK